MGAIKDHTGVRYGKIVGLRPTDIRQNSQVVWEWQCDCGKVFYKTAGHFVHKGYSFGCEDCVKLAKKVTIGKVETTFNDKYKRVQSKQSKEYKAWSHIKDRVLNPDNPNYEEYCTRGMYLPWQTDFSAFLSEIGECPSDGKRYSVGRIDNDGGYFPNNIRWETDEQQNRNRKKPSTNTSGYTGVSICNKGAAGLYAVASWVDLDGTKRSRCFSHKKYGEELALLCAIEARDKAIRLLNQQGAGYSPKHGI